MTRCFYAVLLKSPLTRLNIKSGPVRKRDGPDPQEVPFFRADGYTPEAEPVVQVHSLQWLLFLSTSHLPHRYTFFAARLNLPR